MISTGKHIIRKVDGKEDLPIGTEFLYTPEHIYVKVVPDDQMVADDICNGLCALSSVCDRNLNAGSEKTPIPICQREFRRDLTGVHFIEI